MIANLKTNNNLYKIIFENANDMIRILNPRFEIEFINENIHKKLLGFSKEELIGQNVINFIHPEDIQTLIKTLKKNVGNKELKYEFRTLTKDNKYLWVEGNAGYIYNEYNEKKILVILRDINQLKTLEQNIKNSEEKYRNLINNITDIIIELDINGVILYVSPQITKIAGYEPKELIGIKIFQFIIPADISIIKKFFKEAKTSNRIINNQFRMFHKNGKIISIASKGRLVKENDNQKLIFVLRDETEKKESAFKLMQSIKKYYEILENIKEGYFEVDIKGDIIFFNKALCDILGYDFKELEGLNYRNFLDGENKEKVFKFFNNVYSSEIPQTAFQFENIKKNREKVIVETSVYNKYDRNGNKIGFYGFVRDKTDKIKAEKIIQDEIKKLKELDQIKDDFVNRASHELKTPLNFISFASSLLEENFKKDFDLKTLNLIKTIKKGCTQLNQIIQDLIEVSLLENRKFKINLSKENLSNIVLEVCKDISLLASDREQNFTYNIQDQVFAFIDKSEIKKVLFNLLINAIKYTPPKGIIFVKLEKKIPNYIEILVKDNGVGFTELEKKKVFIKFGKIERFGFDGNLITEGYGLGLYISKEIIEYHSGTIYLESKGRNKGSSFIINLPIRGN